MTGPLRLDAVILAGGRASRLGGTDKPALRLGARTLLEESVAAARSAAAGRIVVAGPDRGVPGTLAVREQPAFGGPVAALATALPQLEREWLLLLAADLPRATEAVAVLLGAGPPAGDGAVLVDAAGRSQWLAGLYRTGAVREAIEALGDRVHGAALHRLLSGLRLARIRDPHGVAFDVDTWQDVEYARTLAEGDLMQHDSSRRTPPEELDAWVSALAAELGLDAEVPTALLLDLARDVAHGVARPAAPVTTFLVGLAAARTGANPEAVRDAAQRASRLALGWRPDEDG